MRARLYPNRSGKPSMEGLRTRVTDTSGIEVARTMNLSTPITSVQDGPRMAGIANFGGKKAAPFKKGGKRRSKVLVAKAAVRGAKFSKKRDSDNDGD